MENDIYNPKYETSRAIIIGINDYQKVSPLSYAVSDAEGIRNALHDNFSFASENIVMLVNDEATKQNIMSAFLSLAASTVNPDDRILFFFAGHGHTVSGKRGEVGYLVPHDADINDLASLIRWDELTRNADLIPAKHILFIMDACYGGLAITRVLPPGSMRFLNDMLKRYSRQVLTAGKANETVSDSGGPLPSHSVFTGHFLEAINGKAETPEGILTANGVMSYVYEKVAKDPDSNQTPHYGFIDGDGDFIFKGYKIGTTDDAKEKDEDILIAVPATIPESKSIDINYIDETKEYLSDIKYNIRLHDLVAKKIREYISNYTKNRFSVEGGGFNKGEFLNRIKFYEKLIKEMQTIAICIAYWGNNDQHRIILRKMFSRLTDPIEEKSGLVVWLHLGWYPVMLLTYSAGISAIAADRYQSLADILLADGRAHDSTTTKMKLALSIGETISELSDTFKTLPGHERHYVPRSEYLYKLLQPILDDILFLGRDYESLFDKFEIFLALVYADLISRNHDRFRGLPGRFAYKARSSLENPLAQVTQEARDMGNDWPPLKAGFFEGSIDRFTEIEAEYEKFIGKLNWM